MKEQIAKAIEKDIWKEWNINILKRVKAYDDNFKFSGWLYWGSYTLMHLNK